MIRSSSKIILGSNVVQKFGPPKNGVNIVYIFYIFVGKTGIVKFAKWL